MSAAGSGKSKHRAQKSRSEFIRYVLGISVGVTAVAISLVLAYLLVVSRPEPGKNPVAQRSLIVRSIVAQPVLLAREWRGYGTVEARTISDLSAQVSARVIERPDTARVGQFVVEGAVLLRLDARDFELRVEQVAAQIASIDAQLSQLSVELESTQESLALAQEAVALTESELERLRRATSGQASAPVEIERLERTLTGTKRERETLRQQLDLIPLRRQQLQAQRSQQVTAKSLAELDVARCEIRSPYDGYVDDVMADLGQVVSPGTVVARVIDLSRVEVPLQLPIEAARSIAIGTEASLQRTTVAEDGWVGTIVRMSPRTNEQTRTIGVIIEVEQSTVGQRADVSSDILRPGQFVVGTVASADERERLVVPRGAVDADRVFVIDGNGQIETREVELSFAFERDLPMVSPEERQWYVVTSGIVTGDRVAVSNLDVLREGTSVSTIDAVTGEILAFEPSDQVAQDGSVTP